tara:strand:+ start:95 stop:727 length:633 start_codon:yes stop_codon:yes gene_type:complete
VLLKYYYWFWKNVIPPRLCDDIIQYGLKHKQGRALTGEITGNNRDLVKNPLRAKEIKHLKKKRHSNVVWMSDKWIYKELFPYVRGANYSAGWNFQWSRAESCQFTIYRKGQYYGWHQDAGREPYKMPGVMQGKIRKLSMTVSLSDQKEYSGGNLEFDFREDSKIKSQVCKEINSKGSLVVFPSWVLHRVTPVTRGTRYSLVSWYLGDPFK